MHDSILLGLRDMTVPICPHLNRHGSVNSQIRKKKKKKKFQTNGTSLDKKHVKNEEKIESKFDLREA